MIRVLIVDDETPARTRIRSILEETPGRFEIAEAPNAVEALEVVPRFKPQLVFLDVHMPKLTGFEFLQQLPTIDFQVVFQTADDDFALQAFEVNACDYILKPFSRERFLRALGKALERVSSPDRNIGGLLDYLPAQSRYLSKLVVRSGTKHRFIGMAEVVSFNSEEHVTEVQLESGLSFAIEPSLTSLEAQLDPAEFLRVHRNAIVKLKCVREYKTQPEFTVTLKNGRSYKVARDRQKLLVERSKL